eukprot:TRINITY_DN78265_c0_g1_i2.p1 TRINITY_DN78265_c0_g1~~TRINITY_DN78265_c0_g1_i2.p1  ORF type:complete len:251 (-),score=27.67 TRINITY_DN78265_c0_g1_i2:223-915(-)
MTQDTLDGNFLNRLYKETRSTIARGYVSFYSELESQDSELDMELIKQDLLSMLTTTLQCLDEKWEQFKDYVVNNIFYCPNLPANEEGVNDTDVTQTRNEDDLISLKQLDDQISELRQRIMQERRDRQQTEKLIQALEQEMNIHGNIEEVQQAVEGRNVLQESKLEIQNLVINTTNMIEEIKQELQGRRTDERAVSGNSQQLLKEASCKLHCRMDEEQLEIGNQILQMFQR